MVETPKLSRCRSFLVAKAVDEQGERLASSRHTLDLISYHAKRSRQQTLLQTKSKRSRAAASPRSLGQIARFRIAFRACNSHRQSLQLRARRLSPD